MRLQAIIKRCADAAGLEVRRALPGTTFSRLRFTLLTQHSVETALDVGASEGGYARDLRRDGFQGQIVSFEPLPSALATLWAQAESDPAWDVVGVGLGTEPGHSQLHVSGRHTSSSFLEMEPMHLDAAPESECIGREDVPVVRLDDVRSQGLWVNGKALLLKLDVQGYELEVLGGATRTLKDVRVLEAELSFVRLYHGQPLFSELVNSLRDHGFVLVALEPVFRHPTTLELLQVNGLFQRVDSLRPSVGGP